MTTPPHNRRDDTQAISAVIVNYNAGPLLASSVDMLLRSARIGRIHVIDNASHDGSLDALEPVQAADSRLVLLRNRDNRGFSLAVNQALARDDSATVLILNPDCLLSADSLQRLAEALAAHPQAAMAGPMLLHPDGTEQAGGRRRMPTPWNALVELSGLGILRRFSPRLFGGIAMQHSPAGDATIGVEAISGACMLVRRAAIREVGALDEGYFLHCEDLDWCMRMRAHGFSILFVPTATAVHVQGTCSKARPVRVEWHKHRGMQRFYRKFHRARYPAPMLWLVDTGIWLHFLWRAARHGASRLMHWARGLAG